MFRLFVGNDEVDNRLDHLAFEDLLNSVQKFGQIIVFVPISISLILVILQIVEIFDQLFQFIDFFDIINDKLDALFHLCHLLRSGISILSLIFLQFFSKFLDIERIDDPMLPAREEDPPREKHTRIIIYSSQFIVNRATDIERILSETALEQHLINKTHHHHNLTSKQFQMRLDVLEEIAIGLRQFVSMNLAQHTVYQLVIKRFDLQSLHCLLDQRSQLSSLGLQHIQRGRPKPNTLTLLLLHSLPQNALILLCVSIDSRQSQQVLPVVFHIDGVDHVLEHHVIACLKGQFLLHLVGAETIEIEGVRSEINARISGMLHVGLALEVTQLEDNLVESDPLVDVLLQTTSHNVQQFCAKTCSLLDVYQIGQDLAAVETFKELRKYHRVDIHAQKENIGVLLDFPQLLTCHLLQPFVWLRDELHDLERSGVLHQQAISDVTVIGPPLDEGRVEI